MKYLFILGRNVELSKAEVFSYFEKEENKISDFKLVKNALLLSLKKPIDEEIVNSFGGVLSIGEVILEENKNEIEKKLDEVNLYYGKSNKLNYALWDFSESFEIVLNYLKKRFRNEKLKATLKHMTGKINLQEGEEFDIPSSKLIDKEFFVFDYSGKVLFGKIIENCDYNIIEKRDMNKPVRRESLAISPRLSKILINLSKAKKGETLLDPFCGIGGLILEALLLGIKVVGIDKDKNAVSGAKQNLEWFKFNKEEYKLLNEDSLFAQIPPVNAIVTEPDLGETLKKIPQRKEAVKTLEKFEKLITKVIKNYKEKVSGRIVFTSPYIRIGKKRLKCDIQKVLIETGYELIHEIPEFRENQIVGRMIYVLEKG
ncbi:MAG: methyltransferase domain-containing protein [Nanoarchaeota archaeon]|nr:methyltransferase domain-containing protein [Nanoarchaeota archaeon]